MTSSTNAALFSHLLDDTIKMVGELDVEAATTAYDFFADKRVTLVDDFYNGLKSYVHACGKAFTTTDYGREVYARILSHEAGEVIPVANATKIMNDNISKMENSTWTVNPHAVLKSFEKGEVEYTQEVFNRWFFLLCLFGKDGIEVENVEQTVMGHLMGIAEGVQTTCLDYEGYYTPHTEADSNGDEVTSYIPEIYAPDMDVLYTNFLNQYSQEKDLWDGHVNEQVIVRLRALDKINSLVGHEDLKKLANELTLIKSSGVAELKKDFLATTDNAMTQSGHHMVLMGGAGAGKTTAARLIGQLHHEVGSLSKGHIVEVSAKDLIDKVIGGTAIKTGAKIRKAIGGVLFIDEAYKLFERGTRHNFASQAVTELLTAMENESDLVVIFAGYKEPMEKLLKSNAGLPRRVRHTITCPEFSVPQLMQVLDSQLEQRGQVVTDAGRKLFGQNVKQSKETTDPEFWGNAGFIRDYLSNVVAQQELRVSTNKAVVAFQKTGKSKGVARALRTITVDDVKKASTPVPDFLKSNQNNRFVGFRLAVQN